MTPASVAALPVDTLRSLLASEARVARACAEELTRQLYKALEDLAERPSSRSVSASSTTC